VSLHCPAIFWKINSRYRARGSTRVVSDHGRLGTAPSSSLVLQTTCRVTQLRHAAITSTQARDKSSTATGNNFKFLCKNQMHSAKWTPLLLQQALPRTDTGNWMLTFRNASKANCMGNLQRYGFSIRFVTSMIESKTNDSAWYARIRFTYTHERRN
jgi:hypothetical protein